MFATTLRRALVVLAFFLAAARPALADAAPPLVDGSLVLVIGIIALALIGWFLIRGALSGPRNNDGDDDSAGVGPLEGIDEDDEERKKK